MAINLYEFFDLTMETFSDYVSRYEIDLNSFLSEFEDNTESLFIDYQKVYLKKMSQAIIESINEIDSNDPEGEFVFNHLQKKLSTNRRILEFLDNRLNAPQKVIVSQQKENISKTASNDKNNDFTEKPWFIVGLSDAKGELNKINGSLRKKANELGINNHSYVKNQEYKYSIEKTRYIYDYCIENNIDTTDEFKKIVDEFKRIDKNQDW